MDIDQLNELHEQTKQKMDTDDFKGALNLALFHECVCLNIVKILGCEV